MEIVQSIIILSDSLKIIFRLELRQIVIGFPTCCIIVGVERREPFRVVILPGPQGSSNARKILANMFGQAHEVARCLLERLTLGRPVENSSDELWELSIEMQNRLTTLNQMSYVSDLNRHVIIEKVVRRLTLELQQKWVEKASKIDELDRELRFEDLIEFVGKRARVAGCRYNFTVSQRIGGS